MGLGRAWPGLFWLGLAWPGASSPSPHITRIMDLLRMTRTYHGIMSLMSLSRTTRLSRGVMLRTLRTGHGLPFSVITWNTSFVPSASFSRLIYCLCLLFPVLSIPYDSYQMTHTIPV